MTKQLDRPTTTAPRPGTVPVAVPLWSRRGYLLAAGAAVLAASLTLVLLAVTGQLSTTGPAAFDPGAAVRYGLPVARVVHDLSAALTVGLLVLATWFVGPERGARPGDISGVRQSMVRSGLLAVTVWFLSAATVLVLTAAEVAGIPVGSPGFVRLLVSFTLQIDLGRALGVSLLLVIVVANLLVLATRVATLAWAAVLSLVALLPLALAGHSSGSKDHMNSVDSLALHLLGVCLWVGGLAALLLVAPRLGAQRTTVVRRYSTLAGWCFALVALSGLVNAMLRLGSPSNLGTSYGLLVVGKTVGLVALGLAGWAHRRGTISRLDEHPHLFARLAVVEVLVMAATMGLAVALSRSAPPVPENLGDPVEALLGYPEPPPLTVNSYFTTFYPDSLWLVVAATMLGLYLAGVRKLHRRGDAWPVLRTLVWTVGCLLLVFITSGGPAVYGRLSFSSHMIQHMTLMVVVPLLLVFGAPVTLALRTLAARRDGSFGPREMLMQLIHARVLKVLGHPLVSAALFTGGLVVFYYTRLFELAMFTHTGHVLMTAHFLLTGYLFVWSLVGVDPGPARPPYPFRLMLLLVTLGFHAFFGISLMGSGTVLAADWWHALGQNDDAALLADQQKAGGIAWGTGDLPSLLIGLALVFGWVKSDSRESKRNDRQADRDGDAELRRYNEQLAMMAQQDKSR